MKKATFIDFDDSFSYNVVQLLTEVGFKVEIVSWSDFDSLPTDGLLVLGPGPGHPDDYQNIFPLIKTWLDEKRPFFGVCLGHQIFWRIQGEDVLRSKGPRHGQRIRLPLDEYWEDWFKLKNEIWVQRYNSLSVMGQVGPRYPHLKNLIVDDEIYVTKGSQVVTYQFHPESIGTSFRAALMRPVFEDLV